LDKTAGKTSIEKFQVLIDQANEKIEKTKAFIAETESKIEKTKAFIAETESKIAFLKETGSDTFDENEFKAFHTLAIIEQGNMSKIEKAKAIAALISKK
jgi:predicted  nucleic acid-binding Zn-ribbon protein